MSRKPHRKAPNGQGSVYRRPNGRWVAAQVVATLPDGRQQRRTHSADTAREAQAWLAEAQVRLRTGELAPAVTGTVADMFRDWLAATGLEARAPTMLGYRAKSNKHILSAIGNVPLAKLTRQTLQGILATMVATDYAPGTVQQVKSILHAACAFAVDNELLRVNLAQHLRCPAAPPAERVLLTKEQCWQLLDAARGTPYEAVPVLALVTGLRIGEILSLSWADVDWELPGLHVRHTLSRTEGGLSSRPTKTAAGQRPVVLLDLAVAALKRQRARVAELRLAAGERWQDNDLICPNHSGRRYWPSDYRVHAWRPLVQAAGLPGLLPHTLRHGLASTLAALGVDPKTVQLIMGHANIRTTLDIYTHADLSQQQEAMQRLDRYLSR